MRGQRLRRVDVRIAVDAPEPQELGALETGNRPEDALLRGDCESRLEPDEVPHLARPVFLPELHDRVRLRLTPGASPGIVEPKRFHRPMPEGLDTPLRHLLDRQAALAVRRLVELVACPGPV